MVVPAAATIVAGNVPAGSCRRFRDARRDSTRRRELRSAVARLGAAGIRVIMLTGDNKATAATVAREVGIAQFRAEVLPADKVAVVTALKAKGTITGMVGDGDNDAPTLAAASLMNPVFAGAAIDDALTVIRKFAR